MHELKKLEHETADTVRIEPCFFAGVDTAIVVMCLAESGIAKDHPKLKRAARMADGKGNSFRRRLGSQKPGESRAERLGF